MKRRNFIKGGLAAGLTPLFVNGYSMSQLGATLAPAGACPDDDRILVIVYLAGANDIINMAVPLNHVSSYETERPLIHLEQSDLITLDDSAQIPNEKLLGLHPSLVGTNSIKSLYDSGKVGLIQRVGYPTPNRSHFASENIMLKGIDGVTQISSVEEGWIGNWLMERYPTYNGLPFGDQQDPLGIIIGGTPKTGFHTEEEHSVEINLSGQDPSGFYNVISSLSGEPIFQFPNSEYGSGLDYISQVEGYTQVYSERISTVFNQGSNDPAAGYPNSDFGNQLKTIARFIAGGSRTKVFMARKGGWDTHAAQVVTGTTETGTHANLLKDLSDSIAAFQKDLTSAGNSGKVMTVVFSEFGRKVIGNGSAGTDHGTLSSMFVIGDNAEGGIYGDNIDLSFTDSLGAAHPDQLEYDYRTVFGSILRDWMGASTAAINNVFPGIATNFNPINTTQTVDPTCYFVPEEPIDMFVRAKVYLGGFLETSGLMRTDLANNGLLPYSQPYGNTKYSYFGSETVNSFPPNTVDWVLLEVLNSNNLVVDRQAIFLRNDGRLMTTTGSLQIPLKELYPEPFKIAIRHRNHISIVVKNTIDAVDGSNPYLNLTTSPTSVDGENQLKNFNGKYAMYPGDSDQNGVINTIDYSYWNRTSVNANQTYDDGDFNGDTTVNPADYNLWRGNRSKVANPDLYPILKR